MKPFILMLHGPSCSGKSAVAKLLRENQADRFQVSADKIKWLISDWSVEKYTSQGTIYRMLFKLAEAAVAENLSLVVESSVNILKEWRPKYQELAKTNHLNFLEVNIEAPFEILKTRFEERVASATNQGKHLSVTDLAGMKERYDAYMLYRDQNLPTFDSSVMSPEEIAKQIRVVEVFDNRHNDTDAT